MDDFSYYQKLRSEHPGYSTIESEPAIFNQILRESGATNAQVQEIYSLDPDIVDDLRPIWGLIFLLRWKEDASNQDMKRSCPEGFWFANQVNDNSCASLAMLNILFNSPNAKISERLTNFRDFTSSLTPPLKGLSLQNFEFLRSIHNSYARRSEIMQNNIDIVQSCQVRKDSEQLEDNNQAAYHFIAYLPADGSVWELDGLKRQPLKLDNIGDSDWVIAAMPQIQQRISNYSDNELMFSLLAVTERPVDILHARCKASLSAMQGLSYGVRTIPFSNSQEDDDLADKHNRRKPHVDFKLLTQQMRDEEQKLYLQMQHAMRVKYPYTAFMRRYIEILAKKGCLADN